jgi:hypothetical protein
VSLMSDFGTRLDIGVDSVAISSLQASSEKRHYAQKNAGASGVLGVFESSLGKQNAANFSFSSFA